MTPKYATIALERATANQMTNDLNKQKLDHYIAIADIDILDAARKNWDRVVVYCPHNLGEKFQESIRNDGFTIRHLDGARYVVEIPCFETESIDDILARMDDAAKAGKEMRETRDRL